MPGFRPAPPDLLVRFDDLAAMVPEARRKQMFGFPSLVSGGNMFLGVHQDALIIRLSEADRAEFIERYQAEPFEPMPGRPMREYVVVPPGLVADPGITDWVDRSFAYARSLPVKQPKPKKTR